MYRASSDSRIRLPPFAETLCPRRVITLFLDTVVSDWEPVYGALGAGVFAGYSPPHYPDMRAAVEAFAERKFGPGGPFHPDTPGPWKESARVRSSAQVHSEEFKECVVIMAQYIYDCFRNVPGTVPSIFVLTYLQAHHLELEFYDHHFGPGAYLRTHADHMARWHGEGGASPE